MKIVVFGATGRTGVQIVKQALDLGYKVKAFVRDPKKITITDERLTVVIGDILDPQTVGEGVSGMGAALLALGSDKPILAAGTANIIRAMKKYGVKRLIVESSYAFSGSPQGVVRLKAQGMSDEQITAFKPILDDKAAQEKETAESSLEWVIVRPLALTDGEKTGQYRAGEDFEVKLEDSISRADVADFMLKSLKDDRWLHKIVLIAY